MVHQPVLRLLVGIDEPIGRHVCGERWRRQHGSREQRIANESTSHDVLPNQPPPLNVIPRVSGESTNPRTFQLNERQDWWVARSSRAMTGQDFKLLTLRVDVLPLTVRTRTAPAHCVAL